MSPANDWANTPEWRRWEAQVRTELIPKISDSAMTISLVPKGDADVKFAVELGLSIMMDKPIIAVCYPDVDVPPGLLRIADEVVHIDPDNRPDDATRITEALKRVAARRGIEL